MVLDPLIFCIINMTCLSPQHDRGVRVEQNQCGGGGIRPEIPPTSASTHADTVLIHNQTSDDTKDILIHFPDGIKMKYLAKGLEQIFSTLTTH